MYKELELKIDPAFITENEQELIKRNRFDTETKIKTVLKDTVKNLNEKLDRDIFKIISIQNRLTYHRNLYSKHWDPVFVPVILFLEKEYNTTIRDVNCDGKSMTIYLDDILISGFLNKGNFLLQVNLTSFPIN